MKVENSRLVNKPNIPKQTDTDWLISKIFLKLLDIRFLMHTTCWKIPWMAQAYSVEFYENIYSY